MSHLPVHLDYETFSPVNLVSRGLFPYACHPQARILCLAYAIGDAEPKLWHPAQPLPADLVYALHNAQLRAFNANFERVITNEVGIRYGLPTPKMSQWEDTQAIASMCAFPGSLDGVAKALKLPIAKDTDGGRLIRFFCIPQKDGTVNMPKDHPGEFKRLCDYCVQDVRVDRAVHRALPVQVLPDIERKTWAVDAIINERGVRVDTDMAKGAIGMKAEVRRRACLRLPGMTGGKITSVGQGKRIVQFATDLGFPLPNLKKETLAPLLEGDDVPERLRAVLELRADVNLTSLAKYDAMLRVVEADGRIRGVHAYHSATTGRWGGRVVQFQNLPRPLVKLTEVDHDLIRRQQVDTLELLYGNVMPVLRDALRNTVRATPGRQLLVVDKASIEARVLGWLADCKGYEKAYREGLDLYKVTAGVIFNKPYDNITEDERWLGKTVVLGLGYSMGEDTFWEGCKAKGRLLPRSLTKRAVEIYRTHYHEIPKYWYRVEDACMRAVRSRERTVLPHGVVIEMQGAHMTCLLPSGRRLWYPFAYIKGKMTKWGKNKDTLHFMTSVKKVWLPATTYGGRMVENLVQAIARDLLAVALGKLEDAKLDPVLHIHDEVVCDAPAGSSIDTVHTIFRTPPPWGKGLLLGSGGFVSPFYKK